MRHVERGLHDPASPVVLLAVAHHQSGFAGSRDQDLEGVTPREVRWVGRQNVFVGLRAQEIDVVISSAAEIDDWPVCGNHVEQRRPRVLAQPPSEIGIPRRTTASSTARGGARSGGAGTSTTASRLRVSSASMTPSRMATFEGKCR